ncbi:MAG: hypothetical protein Ta2E_01080 [Mycoplasmoidaceae bacterium]|nr:MAG: hypothetical protein Ta2E_01080 [Mycoplasmoidaceae bacterium]
MKTIIFTPYTITMKHHQENGEQKSDADKLIGKESTQITICKIIPNHEKYDISKEGEVSN